MQGSQSGQQNRRGLLQAAPPMPALPLCRSGPVAALLLSRGRAQPAVVLAAPGVCSCRSEVNAVLLIPGTDEDVLV